MAKTPKRKKREPSLHSRAAGRQTSPPPSNLAVKSSADEQPWLYHAQNAGITKKKKKPKQLTRHQRHRQQKGLENAERNSDRLSRKVEDSKHRGRRIRNRRAEWDDVNVGTGRRKDKVDGKENGPDEGEGESDKEEGGGRTWTDKMVDVELKEAMEEIEGFELPGLGTEIEAVEEGKDEEQAKAAADVDVVVGDVDGVS